MNVLSPLLSSPLAPWYMAEALAGPGVSGRGSSLEGGKRGGPQNSPLCWSSKYSLRVLYVHKDYEYFKKSDQSGLYLENVWIVAKYR